MPGCLQGLESTRNDTGPAFEVRTKGDNEDAALALMMSTVFIGVSVYRKKEEC